MVALRRLNRSGTHQRQRDCRTRPLRAHVSSWSIVKLPAVERVSPVSAHGGIAEARVLGSLACPVEAGRLPEGNGLTVDQCFGLIPNFDPVHAVSDRPANRECRDRWGGVTGFLESLRDVLRNGP